MLNEYCFAFAVDQRLDACISISACFCACVNACIMTQLGSISSLVGY